MFPAKALLKIFKKFEKDGFKKTIKDIFTEDSYVINQEVFDKADEELRKKLHG